MLNFDARTLPSNAGGSSPARFTLSAHDGEVSSLDINPHIRGCIATGGADKMVKVWNINEDADAQKRQVSLVTSRDLGVVSAVHPFPTMVSNICVLGQSIHGRVVSRRFAYACCRGIQSESSSVGRRRKRWCSQGSLLQASRGGPYCQREDKRWCNRCCKR